MFPCPACGQQTFRADPSTVTLDGCTNCRMTGTKKEWSKDELFVALADMVAADLRATRHWERGEPILKVMRSNDERLLAMARSIIKREVPA